MHAQISQRILHFCFPDVIKEVSFYGRHKSTHHGFPQSPTTARTDGETSHKRALLFVSFAGLKETL